MLSLSVCAKTMNWSQIVYFLIIVASYICLGPAGKEFIIHNSLLNTHQSYNGMVMEPKKFQDYPEVTGLMSKPILCKILNF